MSYPYEVACRHREISGILVRQVSGTLRIEQSSDDQFRLVSTVNLGFYPKVRGMLIVEQKPREQRLETIAPGLRRAVMLADPSASPPKPTPPKSGPATMDTVLYIPSPLEGAICRVFLHGKAEITFTPEARKAGIVPG